MPAQAVLREHAVGAAVAAGEQRHHDAADREAGRSGSPVDGQRERHVGEQHRHRQADEAEVRRDAPRTVRGQAPGEVGQREERQPHQGEVVVAERLQAQPARDAEHQRVEGDDAQRCKAQLLRRRAQLEPERGGGVQAAEDDRDDDHGHRRLGVEEPGEPLRRAQPDHGQQQPVPARPQQHADRARDRDGFEHDRGRRARRPDEHRGEHGPRDAEGAHQRRRPAQRERRRQRADGERQHETSRGRHELVERTRNRRAHEEAANAGRGSSACRLCMAAALVEPHARQQQHERDAGCHQRPCAFADPPLRDPHREQQREARDDRDGAHPCEHLATQDLLELLVDHCLLLTC